MATVGTLALRGLWNLHWLSDKHVNDMLKNIDTDPLKQMGQDVRLLIR